MTYPNFTSAKSRISVFKTLEEVATIVWLRVAGVIAKGQWRIVREVGGTVKAEDLFRHAAGPLGLVWELAHTGPKVVDEAGRAGDEQGDPNPAEEVLVAEFRMRE